MSQPCPHTLRAVRWAQLRLIKRTLRRIEETVESLPLVADQTDPDKALDDEELADHYIELRERVDALAALLRTVHYRTCGRFAYELRTYCKGTD